MNTGTKDAKAACQQAPNHQRPLKNMAQCLFRSLPYLVWTCSQYQSVPHNFFGWKHHNFQFSLCLSCLFSYLGLPSGLLSISLPEMTVELFLGVVLIGLYLFASRRPKHFPPGKYSQVKQRLQISCLNMHTTSIDLLKPFSILFKYKANC